MQDWPTLMTHRGFVKRPYAIQAWDQCLRGIPAFCAPAFFQEEVHLFTDGSTSYATAIPRSSWAVNLGDPNTLECASVFSGVLHGDQSNYRAEIMAVKVAIECSNGGHLYVDNLAVIQGLLLLLSKGWQTYYWIKHAEAELWSHVWRALEPKLGCNWYVHHVKSHQTLASAETALQLWQRAHNGHADGCAKQANLDRGSAQLSLHHNAVREYNLLSSRLRMVFQLQERVLMKASSASTMVSVRQSTQEVQFSWNHGISFQIPADSFVDALLCPPFLDVLSGYLQKCVWYETGLPCPIQVLYAQFVADTGWLVPINIASWDQAQVAPAWRSTVPSAWIHESSYEALILARQSFSKQCITFTHALKLLVKRFGLPLQLRTGSVLSPLHYTPLVSCSSHWPDTLKSHGFSSLLKLAGPSSLRHFFQKTFQPKVCPIPARLLQETPASLWNAYFVARRRRLRE